MRYQDFSSLSRRFRVMTYVINFRGHQISYSTKEMKTPPEWQTYLILLKRRDCGQLNHSQHSVKTRISIPRKDSSTMLVDSHSVSRCGGRLAKANLSYSSEHTMLVSRDHPLMTLTIKNAHERICRGMPSLDSERNKYCEVDHCSMCLVQEV